MESPEAAKWVMGQFRVKIMWLSAASHLRVVVPSSHHVVIVAGGGRYGMLITHGCSVTEVMKAHPRRTP